MKKSLIVLTMALGALMLLVSAPLTAAEEDVAVQTIEMRVGDSFLYNPYVEGALITAYGEGVIGSIAEMDGAFLSWEPNGGTLSGTAVEVGTYNVTLMATWSEDGHLLQAYQVMLFVVGENNGDVRAINYGSGPTSIDGWTQTVQVSMHSSLDDVGRGLSLIDILCIGMTGVCGTIFVMNRDPLSLIFTVAFGALTVCDLLGVIL